MRVLLMCLLLITSINSFSQTDYKIQINDTVIDISVNNEYNINLNGKEIKLRLIAKDTLLFDDNFFSFNYSKDYKVSRLQVGEGIEQLMIMTAEGSGLLIQKYSTVNPVMLNSMIISEVTKESLSFGFEMENQTYTRKLKSGQNLDVDRAVLTYKDKTNIYDVASIGKNDEGILIMTMIMDEKMSEKGKELIDLMWNSLIYK